MLSILIASLAIFGTAISGVAGTYRQCDPFWGSEILGVSGGRTICEIGGAITLLASLLDDCDLLLMDIDPSGLNKLL